jgi:hypothetical protein
MTPYVLRPRGLTLVIHLSPWNVRMELPTSLFNRGADDFSLEPLCRRGPHLIMACSSDRSARSVSHLVVFAVIHTLYRSSRVGR